MADEHLSTRDLAGTSDPGASDARDDAEQIADVHDRSGAPTVGKGQSETSPADEPLARDQSMSDSSDRPLGEGRTAAVEAGGDVEASLAEAAAPEVATADPAATGRGPLLPDDQSERFTSRWHEIQSSFVDQPRESVEQADALVADLMQRLAASFSNERERLEGQWDRGDDVSTEDLRLALTRYRSFFDRLLSA